MAKKKTFKFILGTLAGIAFLVLGLTIGNSVIDLVNMLMIWAGIESQLAQTITIIVVFSFFLILLGFGIKSIWKEVFGYRRISKR